MLHKLGSIAVALVCVGLLLAWPQPPKAAAQGPPGYTLLATVTSGTTYTDTTCPDSGACQYVITTMVGTLESGPSLPAVAVIPGTGTHTVKLTWTAPTTGQTPTAYHVWLLGPALPPTGLGAAVS